MWSREFDTFYVSPALAGSDTKWSTPLIRRESEVESNKLQLLSLLQLTNFFCFFVLN